jgi:16S rRNA (cytosine1402-N4)-methyltransferase
MLCTKPTQVLRADHGSVVSVAFAWVLRLAAIPKIGTFLGIVDRVFVQGADARAATGVGRPRRPQLLLASRKKGLLADLRLRFIEVRTGAGGWSARLLIFLAKWWRETLWTASFVTDLMVDRAPSSWLWARRPDHFIGRQVGGPGTARPPANFSEVGGSGGTYHLPVFPAEIVQWMGVRGGALIIDGTLGGGGHSEILLRIGARVIGVDRDPEALRHATARLAPFADRFSAWEGNFSQLCEIPVICHGERADGLLLDLGVSSRQLDSAARGFSFQKDGPLDMRMGPTSSRTAADVVNTWPESELARILFEFGEEPKARRIAAAIVRRRAERPFANTLDLASQIEKTVGRQGRTHPATRAFQAIRMAVNEELEALAAALEAVPHVLKPGGRLLVITFHSLEDRMVKRFLKRRSTPELDDPSWPQPRPNPEYQFRLLARRAITPTPEEISDNPRARSAKLRVAQLLEVVP